MYEFPCCKRRWHDLLRIGPVRTAAGRPCFDWPRGASKARAAPVPHWPRAHSRAVLRPRPRTSVRAENGALFLPGFSHLLGANTFWLWIMHAPIRLITYGSLMSGLGLQSLDRLTVTNAARVQLRNAHRGFGKPSRHGNHYAMILESVRPDAPIAAEPLAGSRHCPDGPQGLLLEIAFSDFLRIASREGYEPEALTRLAQVAEDTGSILPSFLWALLEAAQF